jgi:hypothetical protein
LKRWLDPVLARLSLENDAFLVVASVPVPWAWASFGSRLYLGSLRSDFSGFRERTVSRHLSHRLYVERRVTLKHFQLSFS